MVHDAVIFAPGEIVHFRHLQHEKVAGVFPMHVVRHDETGLMLFGAEGDHFWYPSMPDGRMMREVPLAEWVATDKPFTLAVRHHSLLSWHPPGVDWSVRFFFQGGSFTSWYVNLEVPIVLWRDEVLAGGDTIDWDLDVVVKPDRSWRWKDEEEFAQRLLTPDLYWVKDEHRVWEAGRQVVKQIEAGVFPFDGTWCDFEPPKHWAPLRDTQPRQGWDRPPAISSAS